MEVKKYIPHPAIQEYVLNISTINVILPSGIKDVVTPYPPTPFQSLIFYCNHPVFMNRGEKGHFFKQPLSVLIGPQFSRVNIKVQKQLNAIRVDFFPGGMYRILGIPMNELFDEGFDAFDFFGPDMRRLNEQLQNVSELEEGKNIVEIFLLKKAANLKGIIPFDSAMQVLLKNNGNMSIEKAASLSCLGIKQFERISKERIGMNPKMYARILKFSKAYRLHETSPRSTWTQIAYEAGYYDQMHMIRDFKVFAGVNPSAIEKELLSTPLRMQKDLFY